MSNKVNPQVIINKSSISMTSLLTVLLVILKLTGNITISWWWVFAPIWIPWVIVLGLMSIILIGGVFASIVILILEAYENRKYK